MSSIHPSFRSYVIAGLILCSRIPASGAVWDGESSASWSTPINWGANLEPGSGDVAQFPLAIPGTGATITLSAGELASSLLFQGAYTLTLGDITLTTGNISVDPSIIATVNSAIGGSAGLTKLGGGTLVLGGTNTFTGAVAVNAGTLSVAADSNFGVAANAVTLAGSTLQGASFTAARNVTVSGGVSINATAGNFFGISGNLGGSGALTFAGPGTVTLSGAAGTYTGAAQVTAGTLQLNAPNALGADGATLSVNTGGTLAVSSTAALKHALTLNGGTWKGNFTTTTWAGPVTVSGATNNVVVSDSFNTQNILLNEAVAGAGELIVSGNVFSRGLLSFGSTLTSNAGLTSTISIGHGATVENAARFSGALGTAPVVTGKTIGGALLRFTTTGSSSQAGLLQLSDHGAGTANSQTLSYGNNVEAILESGSISLGSGTFAGNYNTGHKIVLGTLTLGAAKTLTTTSTNLFRLEFGGTTTLQGDATISAGATETLLTGTVGGAFGLTKSGTGVLTLGSGTNTFGGGGKVVQISAGTLQAGADGALGNSLNTITLSGGTLLATTSFTTPRTVTLTAASGLGALAGQRLTLSTPATNASSTLTKTGDGALRTVIPAGAPFGSGSIVLGAGVLEFVPATGAGAVALTAASGSGRTFTYSDGTSLVLDRNGNTSVTVTLGIAGAATSSVFLRSTTGTLTVVPSALANLGSLEKVIVNGGATTTNGALSPSMVATASPADSTATFLNYDAANGFTPIAYAAANSQSGTDLNTVAATTNFFADTNASLSADRTLNTLRVASGATVSGVAGTTLTLGALAGPNNTGSTTAGLILNGGTLTVPKIATTAGEYVVYTNTAGATVQSAFTGNVLFTKFGPGTLTQSGALPSGALLVQQGSLKAGARNVLSPTAPVVVRAGANIDLNGLSQVMGSLAGDSGAQIVNAGAAATLTVNQTSAGSFTGPIGGATRLYKDGTSSLTLDAATANTYTGGTTVANGTLAIGALTRAGNGNVSVFGSGILSLKHPSNINTGASVLLKGNVWQASRLDLGGSFTVPLDPVSAGGVITLSASNSSAFNFTGTRLYLGASAAANVLGSITPGLDSTYRFGGGANRLNLDLVNTLSGANAVEVGVPSTLPGGIVTNGTVLLDLGASQSFSGAVNVNRNSIFLLSDSGAVPNVSAFNVRPGGLLAVQNYFPQINDRLPNAAPIFLDSGTLDFTGDDDAAGSGPSVLETAGPLRVGGNALVYVRGGNGGVPPTVELTFDSLDIAARLPGDTLQFQTTSAGGSFLVTGSALRMAFVNAPALVNGILPAWFTSFGQNTTQEDFLTYGTRVTSATYTSTDLTTSTATSIVNQTAAATITNASAYALKVGSGALTGGTVTIGGGAFFNGTATHTTAFAFPGGEALMNSTISTTATLRGNITASTLTKFGSGTIVLDATGGTYSGLSGAQVFVNAGNLVFGNDLLAGTNANLLPTDLRVVLRSFANFSVKDNQTLASLTGGGSAIVGSALAGDTARTLTVNNQADETFVGFLGSTSSASSGVNTSLAKGGAGQWRLTGFTAIGRVLDVRAGELVLGGTTGMGTGVADEQKIIVGPGATLTVDNTEANLADRIGANITTAAKGSQLALNGGRLRLLGHGDVPTSEEFGAAGGQAPNFGAGASTVEIIAGTAQPAVLISALPFTRSPGASALVRGSDLGNTQGNAGVGSLLFRAAPALTGFNSGAGSAGTPQVGILPGVTGASIIAGVDTFGLTTYDRGTTSDYGDYDDKGVRRLAVAELATTITSGDTTTLNNVLRTGGTASITAATAVNALHLSTGAVVSMSGAGTLAINSGTLLSANNGGAGTNSITGGSLTFGSGNEAMVYTASDLTIGSGLAGTLALTKGGPALLTLQGTNSFTGALTVNGGLLAVDSSARLGNAANALTLNNGGGIRATATFTLGRNTTLGASGGAVDVPTAVKLTLSGPIVGGLGTVTGGVGDANGLRADTAVVLHKTGLGELLLTGSETYTGVTSVDAGTLSVGDGVSGSLSGKTVVQNGGTLSGFGSIGAAEILNGGTLAPGGAPGRLTENGNLSFASGARLSLEINGTVAGTGYDQVALNGTLTLGPTSVLAGSSTGGFPNSTLFFPIDNDGSDPIVGTFNGLAQNSTFVLGSQAFRISYTGDSATNAFAGAGNDLAVMAVPEPASMTLLAAGVGALVFWRRARRSFPQK